MSTLVVCATRVEAAHLPDSLAPLITGLGKTAAAARTAAALARDPGIGLVVNLGSAGALREGLEGIFLPGQVLNHELTVEPIVAMGYQTDELLQIPGGDETVLASGDIFVADPTVRARLAERAHLVDMEGYGVAWACRDAGVPVRLVKHVSDQADERSMTWPELVDQSARALAEWAVDHLC